MGRLALKWAIVLATVLCYYLGKPESITLANTEGFAPFLVVLVIPLLLLPIGLSGVVDDAYAKPLHRPQRISFGTFFMFAIALALAYGTEWWIQPSTKSKFAIDVDHITVAKQAVERKLRDPSSAEYRGIRVLHSPNSAATVCGEVNAKNAFGGYAGFERFVSGGSASATVLEHEVSDFQVVWSSLCD